MAHQSEEKYWKDRRRHLRRCYGITLEDYNDLYDQQEGRCAICKEEEKREGWWLHVDHDHSTGEIRGLLCSVCNLALGHIERQGWLSQAQGYLGHQVEPERG